VWPDRVAGSGGRIGWVVGSSIAEILTAPVRVHEPILLIRCDIPPVRIRPIRWARLYGKSSIIAKSPFSIKI
jgi:hypothetical protein